MQTADAQILPNGTAYITDLGMTGPIQSVLGIESKIIISRLKDHNTSEKFVLANNECMLNGCIFDIDDRTGLAVGIESICIPKHIGVNQ